MRPNVLNKREERRKKLESKNWYEIKNQTGDLAEIRIYDEIGWFGITAENFVRDLDDITAPEIIVAINCPGGDVFDGIAIYNALRSHPAKVTTRVDSLAASIASIIAQAGDQRIMLSSSQMMIHDAWGLTIGNARDMREMADLLDRQSDILAGIYAGRGTGDVAHYRDLMEKDSWFTDEETVAEGLADEVIDPSDATSGTTIVTPESEDPEMEAAQTKRFSNAVEVPSEPDAGSSSGADEAPDDDPAEEEELHLRARALALQGEAL